MGDKLSDGKYTKLIEDFKKMSRRDLLISFNVERINGEQKSKIIDRIIDNFSMDEIKEKLVSKSDTKYFLRERCFELGLPFKDKDKVGVLNERTKNYVRHEYKVYTYNDLRTLNMTELKALMNFHYLNISTHDTENHLRGILNMFYTEETPGKIRKMLYDGYIYYNDGFKDSILDQVNFIINGLKEDYGNIPTRAEMGIFYKINSDKGIDRWLTREALDPEMWKVFHRHANIYATKEGLIMNLTNGNFTPYKGTTVPPNGRHPSETDHLHIKLNCIAYYCHIIIALIYCENDDPIKNTVVDHLDGLRDYNDSSNLRWTDNIGNANNMHYKPKTIVLNQLDEHGNITDQFGSIEEAAKKISIRREYISNCCRGHQQYVTKNGIKLRFEYAEPKILHDVADKSKYSLIGHMPTKIGEELWPNNHYNYYVSHDDRPKLINGKSRLEVKSRIVSGYQYFSLTSSNNLVNEFYGQHIGIERMKWMIRS